MQQKSRWIPWAVGGVIILILVIFSLVGGIGAIVKDPLPEEAAVGSTAPAPGGASPAMPQ